VALMHHVTVIEFAGAKGHLGLCETCGARNDKYTGFGEAHRWCDDHAHKAAGGRLNDGPRQPSLRTVEKVYRENANNDVYTPEERAIWQMMADEMAEEIAARNPGQLPGQMELWPETPEGDTG
jgi:hypothetical protein